MFLPNLITFFNLFSGFLSIMMASSGHFRTASWLIVVALVWDSLDGSIARIFKNSSALGRELDSLADVVSFVVAPAFLIASFMFHHLEPWTLLPLFGYLACGAYRLARFNLQTGPKNYFVGLPTPAAAITIAMTTLACIRNNWTDPVFFKLASISIFLITGFLMVSHVAYPKFSAMPFSKWRSLLYLSLAVCAITFKVMNPETALAAMSCLFVFVSPVTCLHVSSPVFENLETATETH